MLLPQYSTQQSFHNYIDIIIYFSPCVLTCSGNFLSRKKSGDAIASPDLIEKFNSFLEILKYFRNPSKKKIAKGYL